MTFLTYLLYMYKVLVFVLLPQASISGPENTRNHFLWNFMGTFDYCQLRLSGKYILLNTKSVTR